MKDEEMAEEYVKKEGFRSGMFGELDNITSSEANKEIKQAFLAGLKAGRPQWHTDQNDLPEKYNHCSLSRTVVNQIGTPCHYNYELQCWQNWSYIEIETPIAWCEIPTFDKE